MTIQASLNHRTSLQPDVRRDVDSVGAFIVTFQRPRLLRETLRAVMAQTRELDSVVVLNNDPGPDLRTRLTREFPGVTVVNLGSNVGSAGGFAAALRLAYDQGLTWAWLLDDDAMPYPDALRCLLADSHVVSAGPPGILAPLQVSPRGVFGVSLWRNGLVDPPAHLRDGTQPYPVDVAYWAGLLVHRRVIEAIGYPRTDFFRCFGDYEYCLRARAAGLPIMAIPTSRVRHDHGSPSVVVRFGRSSVRFNYAPLRGYYDVRNAAYTTRFVLRNPSVCVRHALNQVRLGAGNLLYDDRKAKRIWLRLLGLMDGFRGRLGRREDLE